MRIYLTILSFLLVSSFGGLQAGSVRGTVRGEGVGPVAKARVIYTKASPGRIERDRYRLYFRSNDETGGIKGSTSTGEDGSFVFSAEPGQYVICVEGPDATFLDTCRWSAPTIVTVANESISVPSIVISKGATVRVLIHDPANLLPDLLHPFAAPNLIVGLLTGTDAFHAATQTAKGATWREYSIAAPAGEDLRLWLFSRHVQLADSNNQLLQTPGAAIPVGLVGVTGTITLNFDVRGRQ